VGGVTTTGRSHRIQVNFNKEKGLLYENEKVVLLTRSVGAAFEQSGSRGAGCAAVAGCGGL
jgi:hypothetical protein